MRVHRRTCPWGRRTTSRTSRSSAPFTLDLDNMADKQWSGYFFDYDKLFWAYTGERTTVGSHNVSETILFNGVKTRPSRPRTA